MRKFFLGLVCVLVVVGVASMGHAGLLSLFGSSGGKGSRGGHSGPSPAIFKFNFDQFGVKQDTKGHGPNNPVSNNFEDYLKLPERGSNHFGWNNDDGSPNLSHGGPYLNHGGSDSILIGNWRSENVPEASAPVPEPASMLLFGTGCVVFGGYLRKKLKKQA